MHTVLIGLFDTYGQAEAVVRDLELAAIVGEEVEVLSDVDRNLRAKDLGLQPQYGIRERMARALESLRLRGAGEGPGGEIHDDPGEMPDYIGEQEFYATHVKEGAAIVVVRPPSRVLAARAEAILKEHGSKTRDGKSGALIFEEDERPRQHSAGAGS
jgi:hypothetical protein